MQIYVIWVVLHKSPPAMFEYRYFLCLYTFCDMVFTFFFGFVIHPDPLFPSKAGSITGLAKLLGQSWSGLSMGLVSGLAAAVVFVQDYCLLYRMTVVLEDKRYHDAFVSKPSYIVFHIAGVVVAVTVGLPFLHSVPVPNTLENIKSMMYKYPTALELVKPDMVIIYLDTSLTWAKWMMLIIILGIIVASVVSFGAVFAILRTLRKNASSFSARTYRLHLQLTVLLLAQLSSPTVFVMFPIIVAIVSMLTHFDLYQWHGRIGFLLFAMYAPCNSVLVIFFVSPYRRFTAECVRRVLPKRLVKIVGKPEEIVTVIERNTSMSLAVPSMAMRDMARRLSR